MKKYLELFKDGFDSTITEKTKVENWPYVGYSLSEGIVFTVIPDETRFVFVEGQNQLQLSATGLVIIESVQGGEKVRETYSALDNTYVTINADEGTEVVIYGAVTVINYDENENLFASLDLSKNTALTDLYCNGCTGLTSLDLSKNTALTYLNCSDCTGLVSLDVSKNTALTELYCAITGLTSLDVSKNTALTRLNCSNNSALMLLDIQNTQALKIGTILDQSMANLTTLQVAGTNAWGYEQVESWLNGDAPSDGTILVDENTPQEVITAATVKNWTVEYVDV